ncbi:MAG: hypothetical protein Q8K71_04560 [Polaromonas sp.]|nr:hypothetical protein [Polaromonas sp.]MDP3753770.1 hypothetical protein [Polaromonas sp.]
MKIFALALLMGLGVAYAAPYTPASDAEVVERLPGRASDPAIRRVDSLRKQLSARPEDIPLRLEIARRYFDLAMAQGDPRYVGYASSALAPLATSAAGNADYWLVRGLIQQYSHQFEAALASLAKSAGLNPRSPEPLSWRAAIFMVRAQYPAALAECERLTPLADPLLGAGCSAYVQAATGQLQQAFESLTKTAGSAANTSPEMLLWLNTRLAEMAVRLQRNDAAEGHFRNALKQGVTDQFLLGAYADFLLARDRPAEVLTLLAGWERSDILLLRLALAGRAAKDTRAAGLATQLRERFDAAALRGDSLHEQEAARFELDIENQPAKALDLASRNYQDQKEPRDAEVLMRAALAAKQPRAAVPALDWLRNSKYEDPALKALADKLSTPGAGR